MGDDWSSYGTALCSMAEGFSCWGRYCYKYVQVWITPSVTSFICCNFCKNKLFFYMLQCIFKEQVILSALAYKSKLMLENIRDMYINITKQRILLTFKICKA